MSEPKPLLAPLRAASAAPRLWKNGAFAADPWQTVADDTAMPIGGHAIISLQRWRAEQMAIAATGHAIGIAVAPVDTLDPATDDLDRLGVIALAFPKFTDGRAYSTARRLREQWGYRGEVRAIGDVLLDQLPLMLRAGFDACEITHAATIAALAVAPVPAVSRVYQHGSGGAVTSWQTRRPVASAMG